jgi:glyoxylase-like metal-dependent hydrolase (beta-lactamase superfamily II)
MHYRQFLQAKSGCASYFLGCGGTGVAAVIDPVGPLEPFLREAEEAGCRITHVVETHAHADHHSSARQLAKACGADLYLHRAMAARFPFKPLDDGDEVDVGNVHMRVLHTPGHTRDSLSLVVEDRGRVSEPWFVLTGDTLLVGDVGRPDLTLDDADSVLDQARTLYASLFERILPLGDALEIHPSHYGISPCGGHNMSRKPFSTIGFERRFNLALQLPGPEAFGRYVLSTLRPQPEDFRRIKMENLGWE